MLENGLGRVTDSFHGHIGVEEADNAARTPFEPFVTPGKCANHTTLAEHHLDVTAEILRMQQAFLESPAVEREHILLHPAAGLLVRVFERAKVLRRCLAVLSRKLLGEIGSHATN